MTHFKNILLSCLMTATWLAQAQTVAPSHPAGAEATVTQARIIRGTDEVLAPANSKGQITGAPAGLKFEETPLTEVVGLVLREIAKVDYVVHPPINGTVTLSTQGEVSADHAMLLLEAALQANGLQIARDSRGVFHIGRPEALRGIVPAVRQAGNGPLPPGYGAIIVPLKFMGAGEMATILRPMAPPEAIVRVDTLRNLLVLIGTRTQAEGWLDIVATFDVDLLKGMSVGVFPLKHVTTKEVESALRLFSGGGTPTQAAQTGGAAGTNKAADPVSSAALPTSFPLQGALRVIPIERINSVMIVTPRAAYLDEARRWIEKLDQPGGNSVEAQLFVYPVQNGNAKHLANVLNGLFGGATPPTTQPTTSGVAPGLQQNTATTTGVSAPILGGSSATSAMTGGSASAGASSIQGTGLTTLTLNAGLRVMADEINNAVLVYGNRGEYEKVEATLKRLDVPPTQVLIEASIIEVSLNDDLQYGLQWIFNDPARNGFTGSGSLLNDASIALGSTVKGFSYTIRNTLGDVRAVLNALAAKSLVKVISSPSLMVLDNHTASISVGDQQPIRVGETVTANGIVTNNFQYKDTGLTLAVTPSVNAGNMVTMQINQSVTDVGAVDEVTKQRAFLQRQFTSKVAVRSGETLVLGGLIKENTTTSNSGVPLLQDIPLFGSLFGTNGKKTTRTELLVIITPRTVRTEQDVRQLGQELRNRMKSLFPLPPPESPAETR